MLLPRELYTDPPPARTKVQDNPTLLTSWWCTGFAVVIILLRLSGRYVRTERLFQEDKIMALSLIPLLGRMGLVHLVLIWGTNNAKTEGLTPLQIHHREIGSRLILASRILYALFIWVAKFTISEFLKRLTSQVWKDSYEKGLKSIRWFLVLTFFVVVIGTLSECQPFDHYWQVVPDPGAKCREGVAQLFTMGVSDVITDLLLVCFPIPIVLKSAMAVRRKVSIVLLFALSLFLVGITIYRVQGVIARDYSQQFRSLLASIEILAAAAVSNSLVLGSFIRDRGAKKQRFRFSGTGEQTSLDRSQTVPHSTITARHWGSDADLAGDLGMGLGPEFAHHKHDTPRPAPVAMTSRKASIAASANAVARQLDFGQRKSIETYGTDETDIKEPECLQDQDHMSGDQPSRPKRVSLFDVGGLLGGSDHISTPSQQQYTESTSPNSLQIELDSAARPTEGHNRRGSYALLQDIGGLLPSPQPMKSQPAPPRPGPSSANPDLIEALQSKPPASNMRRGSLRSLRQKHRKGSVGLQDVGGLLS